jgi:DNA-binding transcriptional regulator LsrR (DeoR family)
VIDYSFLTKEDQDAILARTVVGDVAFRFIDQSGKVADIDFNKRVVACNLTKIRKNAREVIAIAYGTGKAEAIKAVLKGGLLTTLFTDYDTAQLLL